MKQFFLHAAVVLFLTPVIGLADTIISVNIAGGNENAPATGVPPAAGQGIVTGAAGIGQLENWNNLIGTSGLIPVIDADGNPSGATVSWATNNTWSTQTADGSGGDADMMSGYLDNFHANGNITVTGLGPEFTDNGYEVLVYFQNDNNLNSAGFRATDDLDNTDTRYGHQITANNNYPLAGGTDGYVVSTETAPATTSSSNVVRLVGLTGPDFTLTGVAGVGPSVRARPNAIQIITEGDVGPSGRASVENNPAINITSSSATLRGTVTDIGDAAPTVTIFYGDDDAGTEAGDWDDSITLAGTHSGAFSASASGLAPGTSYFFRAQATNASGSSWAPDTATFQTTALAPTVVNLPAADIQSTSAVIGSDVTDTGGEVPIVRIYWGTGDGGTDAGNWGDSVLIGAQSGPGTTAISGLQTGSTYFFRAFASNGGGSDWAPSTASFTTEQPVPPGVENRAADGISGTSANLRGSVTDLGFDAPNVTLYYGTDNGGTDIGSWDTAANLGLRTGDFSFFLSGLDPLTTYYFRARATNVAGSAWAPSTASFDTSDPVSGAIVINEIHYDHEPKTQRGEFVELYNSGDALVDLSGWKLNGVGFTFPAGSSIAANGFVVVAEDPATALSEFGVTALGPYSGKLSNDGDRIELEDASGARVDIVSYGIGFPWPTSSRGAGASMELINETLDNDLGSSWRGSQSGFSGPQVTYVSAGGDWSYRKGNSEASNPVDQWRSNGFVEDATWLAGTTVIGYGDGDDTTVITDMQSNYASVFLRKEFEVSGQIPSQLLVRVYHDDGAIVWINGVEVARINVDQGDITFEGARASDPGGAPTSAVTNHEAAFTEVIAVGAQGFLVDGTNTVAVHGFNSTLGSSDFSIDCEIKTPSASEAAVGVPSPGAANSVFSPNAAPNIRQVTHAPEQPVSGEDVVITARVTDPDGVGAVTLSYQLVEPGNYIRKTDAEYDTNWTDLPMVDDGTGGDVIAGDSVFTGVMPGSFQVHRRLVRYRITVEDSLGISVQTPFADDESPNFAYFCYDGVPDWTGSKRPGNLPNVTYPAEALENVPVYHLITRESDVVLCQWSGPTDGEYRYLGTWVYDGKVYDHMRYRIRGRASTRQVGKNKWKFNFNRARPLEARDNYGKKYKVAWDKINGLPGTNPWWRNNASTDGTMFSESLGFRMYQLAGGVGSNTHFYHFRIIDDAQEAPAGDQYAGDFWGLYIAIEQPEAEFLNERGLPDGNIYNVHGGTGSSLRNQGATQVSNKSDLLTFQGRHSGGTSQALWEDILDFEDYFAFNAMNLAINNSDMRPQENVNYYHNSETDKWHILPWDIDLTFEDAPHLGRGDTAAWERIYNCLQYPQINQAYENQVRHILNLLLDNDQSGHVVDEFAGFISKGGPNHLADANQAVWDYHPRKNKKGIWYANFNNALLPSRTFDGLVEYTKDFLTVGGYGRSNLASKQTDAAIPNKPTITFVGAAGFPTDGLMFQSSAFADPQGSGTFGTMEWRVGEIHNPSVASYVEGDRYVYEIETAYQTERMAPFQSQFTFPPAEVRVGHTYRARVRHIDNSGRASNWSDPVEFTATEPDLTPWAENLMITELMYHPTNATPDEIANGYTSSDFEYVELQNISATLTLDLSDLRFTKGIDFDFVDGTITSLAPGAYLIIVRDQAAFEARHGAGLPVTGEYGPDNLSNSGENVKLSFGAGSAIHEFTYDDEPDWPTSPDGLGFSLTLVRPQDAPDHADPLNWRASGTVGGTPASSDALAFAGDANADGDGDGLVALAEYFFGQSDTDPNTPRPWDSEVIQIGGTDHLAMSYTAAVGADDVLGEVEITNDLVTWRSGAGEVELVSETPNGDGTSTYVFRSANPVPPTMREYMRLRLTLR